MKRTHRSLVFGVLALVLSAGAVLVTHRHRPDQRSVVPPSLWKVEAPLTTIGVPDGPLPYVFGQVSAAGTLSDGSIFVADAGFSELRIYDQRGKHRLVVGRKGRGPGEFSRIIDARRIEGDTIVVLDRERLRRTWVAPDGGIARTISADPDALPPGGFPRMLVGSDGVLLEVYLAKDVQPGLSRPLADLFLLRGRARIDTLGQVALNDVYRPKDNPGNAVLPPLARLPAYAVANDVVYVGDMEAPHIYAYTLGRETRRIPTHVKPRYVDRGDAAAIRSHLVDRVARNQRLSPQQRRTIEKMDIPSRFPDYASLAVALNGDLWLEEYVPSHERSLAAGISRWNVISLEGNQLATVELPSGVRLLEIAENHLLWLFKDQESATPAIALAPLTRR